MHATLSAGFSYQTASLKSDSCECIFGIPFGITENFYEEEGNYEKRARAISHFTTTLTGGHASTACMSLMHSRCFDSLAKTTIFYASCRFLADSLWCRKQQFCFLFMLKLILTNMSDLPVEFSSIPSNFNPISHSFMHFPIYSEAQEFYYESK